MTARYILICYMLDMLLGITSKLVYKITFGRVFIRTFHLLCIVHWINVVDDPLGFHFGGRGSANGPQLW